MAGELAVALLTMLYSYTRLRRAAIAARSAVLEAYRQEETEAVRLMTRLESYAQGTQPLQDDEETLVHGLEQLIGASSTTPTDAGQAIAKRIKKQTFSSRLARVLGIRGPTRSDPRSTAGRNPRRSSCPFAHQPDNGRSDDSDWRRQRP